MASKAPLALLLALLAIAILLFYEVTAARDLTEASKDTTQSSESHKEIENTIIAQCCPDCDTRHYSYCRCCDSEAQAVEAAPSNKLQN